MVQRFLIAAAVICISCRSTSKGTQNPATDSSDPHHALMLETSSLPACTDKDEGWLIYQKTQETFVSCTAGVWVAVELKGLKGDKGDKGDKGNTIVSATLPAASPPIEISSSAWPDPMGNLAWLAASALTTDQAPRDVCVLPWRLAKSDAVITAISHGLKVETQCVWFDGGSHIDILNTEAPSNKSDCLPHQQQTVMPDIKGLSPDVAARLIAEAQAAAPRITPTATFYCILDI